MPQQNVAFLGPVGSYSEQAVRQFDSHATAIPKPSISEVFAAIISGEVAAAVVPIENKIQGPVTETLDLLLKHKELLHIVESFTTNIVHCLGTLLPTLPLTKITGVYSHQQALEQCSQFLSATLPKASRHPTSSTSAAAVQVAREQLSSAAVIASEQTLTDAGLAVRKHDIADISHNQTRFVVLHPGSYRSSTATALGAGEEHVTSIIVCPGRDRQGLLFELLEIISARHFVNLLSIHSRPDLSGGFVFHIDLAGHSSSRKMAECLNELDCYCREQTAETARVVVCGSYRRATFRESPFASVGVIGINGIMGKFFAAFFEDAGFTVIGCDVDTKLSVSDIAKQADVILLSVPMEKMSGVIVQLTPHLRKGQLVIENCSIKGVVLPELSTALPAAVEVVGIHTMFSGDTASIRGQNIIITETDRSGQKARAFADVLYKYGARLSKASIEEHDEATSFVQSLVHFSSICIAEVMQQHFETPKQLAAFSTPNARRVLDTIERVSKQDPALSLALQTKNDKANAMRMSFLQTVFDLVLALNRGETEQFEKSLTTAKHFFSKE